MTHQQTLDLTADFLAWSGGFGPSNDDEIGLYMLVSLPTDLDERAARTALLRLMRRAARSARAI